MGVSGQRHAPAALYSRGKDPPPVPGCLVKVKCFILYKANGNARGSETNILSTENWLPRRITTTVPQCLLLQHTEPLR